VGEKNVIAMMAESFVAIGIVTVTVLWVVVGYSDLKPVVCPG
jgi:ammonia channel protein AmtB